MAWFRCTGGSGGSLKLRTASGAIASFETNYVAPLNSLKCEINAKQDLHGYAHPWAGGAGKNKTDIEDKTISEAGYVIGGFPVAINSDNSIFPSGNYVFSFEVQNATFPCACQLIWYRNGVEVGNTVENISASGINSIAFTSSGEFDSFVMFCNSSSGGAFTNFNLNIGSTPSPYEPYANICPIVGHSELNLTRCGVNLWDEEWETGGFNADGTTNTRNDVFRTKNYIQVPPNTVLHIHQGNLADTDWCYPVFYDINKTPITRGVGYGTITMPANAYYLRVQFNTAMGNTYANNISINYPSTDTAYHHFSGQTFTVAFGQTVYGGVYDKSGRLTITHGYVDLGDLTYSLLSNTSTRQAWSTSGLVGLIKPPASGNDKYNAISSGFTAVSYNATWLPATFSSLTATGDQVVFCVEPNAYVDSNAMKAAMNGIMLAYELATPIVIDVPSISVFAENGVNNIVSDCGGDVNVSYLELIRHND